MERADQVALKAVAEDDEGAREDTNGLGTTIEEQAFARPVRQRPLMRWLAFSSFINALAVLLLVGGAVMANRRFDELVNRTRGHEEATALLTERLTASQEAVRSEVDNLRQTMVSRTSEDVIFLKIVVLKPKIDMDLARRIAKNVHHYSNLYARDPNLVLALMEVESDFNPKAVSNVGALGLMQVMPHWKKVLGIDGDLTDPEVSIKYGLQILGFYEEMYKDLHMALTAYNRGPGPIDRALMRGEDPNNNYAPKVLEAYERLKRLNVQAADL